jgi:spore germination cell wall hydrolase CwlJ-like protein
MVAYTEARSEGAVGMAAVMGVVLNRVADKRWPKTVCDVATQRDQFLGLQNWRGPIDVASWKSALAVADIALSGAPLLPAACRGAVFFHAGIYSAQPPKNAACRVGAHVFVK